MAECLARVHVRQVHLDERDRDRGQRIAQGNAGVGERARVDHDEGGAVLRRRVHAIDQLVSALDWKVASSWPDACAVAASSASIAASVVRP